MDSIRMDLFRSLSRMDLFRSLSHDVRGRIAVRVCRSAALCTRRAQSEEGDDAGAWCVRQLKRFCGLLLKPLGHLPAEVAPKGSYVGSPLWSRDKFVDMHA